MAGKAMDFEDMPTNAGGHKVAGGGKKRKSKKGKGKRARRKMSKY